MDIHKYLSQILFTLLSFSLCNASIPNIVFVLMDDLGWHDVSFNGGQFPTPNIDSLWSESVELNRHYIHLMCSPSRTQFLTGRYAMRQGIGKMLPWDYTEIGGIPVGQPTVADWLKVMANYTTYAVGKWHCGYAYEGLLPTSKGFDHFFGFYQGAIHYGNMKYIDIKFGESDHFDFWEDKKEYKFQQEEEMDPTSAENNEERKENKKEHKSEQEEEIDENNEENEEERKENKKEHKSQQEEEEMDENDEENEEEETEVMPYSEPKHKFTSDENSGEDNEEETDEIEQMNTMYLYRDKIVEYIDAEADRLRDEEIPLNEKHPFYMYIPLQTIHGPLDRVHEYTDQCDAILGGNIARRSKYCQNMLLTDDVIGTVMNALKDNELWQNTLFILTTDNGADIANKGCNFPLRGTKGTLFDGNTRTISLVGGGVIPTPQRGTYRDALFSSLDWTPTLLHYARALHKIDSHDYTWDGVDQHDLIMKGVGVNDEYVKRDHIVFNIGLRNLDSASIVFIKNNHLYKYIAQDGSIDQWTYKREDGWCVPESNGDWNMILDDDISLAQHVNDKYLFDLTYDISERTNLLQLQDQDEDNNDIVSYAKEILTRYTNHALFSEHLKFLWNRLASGDPKLFGEGSFVAPFLTEHEYFRHLAKGFSRIEEQFEEAAQLAEEEEVEFTEVMPYSKKLKGLYFHKWQPPKYATQKPVNTWYIYTIIGIVIVALIVIVIISIARWRHLKSFYKDGYEPITNPKRNEEDNKALKHSEVKELLNKNSNSTSHSDSDSEHEPLVNNSSDRVEYTHVDSNKSNVNSKTPLVSVQN